MSPGGAGDLTITIGGDLTPLETALASVPEAFAGVTSEVQDAFAGLGASIDTVAEGLTNLAASAEAAAAPVEALGEQLDLFAEVPLATLPEVGEQLQLFATYAGEATVAVEGLNTATAAMTPSIGALGQGIEQADESTASFIGRLGLALIAVRTLQATVTDMATAYGDLEKSQLALGALLGNTAQADAAIDSIKQLADQFGVLQASAISTQQKLIALGEPLANIPRDFTAIADGAAAMNTAFDTAAQRFDQIVNSGSLMARSLTSIGLSTNDVATAMGMAGVPATLLTTAFKGLDEQQRAAVISSAELAKNAGLAAAAASGVAGTWTDVKNSITDAWQAMGKAVDGFAGLASAAKDAVGIISQLFVSFVADVKIAVDGAIAVVMSMIPVFTATGKVLADGLSGNFAGIPGDIKDAVNASEDALKSGWSNIQTDAGAASASISKTWGDGMQAVVDSSKAAGQQAGAALNVLQAAADNAQKNFNAVAAAFAAGKISATAYTAELTALNKAQEDANGGLEQFGTAILIQANDFRVVTVGMMNAKTNLDAIAAAASVGASNWTAYDAALKALNKDQMDFNNGLEDAHTAFLNASEDFQNHGVAEANAETQLQAIVQVYGAAADGTKAYTDALNAQQAAQTAAAQGVMNLQTAILQAANTQASANLTWRNTEIELQAAYTYYMKTGEGLQQVIDLTQKLAQVQATANNGIMDNVTANNALVASHTALELAVSNANTQLAQAQALYAQDTSYGGLLQEKLTALKTAQDALTGTNKTAISTLTGLATAQQQVTSSVTSATQPLSNLTAYWENVDGAMRAVETTYQMVNGTLVVSSQNLTNNAAAAQQVQTTYQNLNGTIVVGSTNLSNMAAAASKVQTTYQTLNGTLVATSTDMSNVATAAGTAASAITGVGTAAAAAAKQVQSLGRELDALMGDIPGASLGASLDASMNGKIGDLNMTLKPGDTYSNRTYTPFPLGASGDSSGLGLGTPPAAEQPAGTSLTVFDPVAAAATAAATALTSTATASTTVTAATAAMTAAIQQATDANVLEQAAAQASGTAAYSSLKSVADAAAQAAAAALASAEGLTANTAALAVNTDAAEALAEANTSVASSSAGLSTAALNAGNAVVALTAATTTAATTLSTVSTSAVNLSGVLSDSAQQAETALMSLTTASEAAAAAAIANNKTPVIGSSTSLYTPYATGIGTGSGFGGTPNAAGPTISLTVQNNGTVVGANGMQQLSDMVGTNIVKTLGARGIRLNRQ